MPKECSICGIDKHLSEYYQYQDNKYYPYCKKCHKEKNEKNKAKRVQLNKIINGDFDESEIMIIISHVIKDTTQSFRDTIKDAPNENMSRMRRGILADIDLLEQVLLKKYILQLKDFITNKIKRNDKNERKN